MQDQAIRHIHLVSDSTGETVNAVFRAAMARFPDQKPQEHVTVFIRSEADLDEAIAKIESHPGLVIYTLADRKRLARLQDNLARIGVPAVPILTNTIRALSDFFGVEALEKPGMQHGITTDYFDRISALDFAIAYDDGALGNRLQQADVILTGVSRTSKTPTCIYLAYRGMKAANVPLVPRTEPDPAFFETMQRGEPVIGLVASPSRLAQIRTQRLETLGSTKTAEYAELDQIRSEVAEARLFFDRHEIPVIDVTRRSIEETAAEVLSLLRDRRDNPS